MQTSPLPTPWALYNLTGSPYFQETLEATESSPRPLNLFVGRAAELEQLTTTIRSAGARSSRQAIAGQPGVGKTTLVQELKGQLLSAGYLSTDNFVPIYADDTTASLFGRVLGALYDTIIANRPGTLHNPAMEDARQLVRTSRLGTGGANLSAMGVGAGMSRGVVPLTPDDLMIDGPRVMRGLMQLVQSSDAHGVLIHINNLENLSDAAGRHAAEILRGLRDPMLMHNGLHVVVVGTTDSINTVINTHTQLRSVFSTLVLEPLLASEVHGLLDARYDFLTLDRSKLPVPPVSNGIATALYTLYQGDLRGLLKALDDGVTPLLGLAGTDTEDSPRPLTLDELRPVLGQRYRRELESLPEQVRVRQLTTWGSRTPDSAQTQKSLTKLWKVSQSAVSTALNYLIEQGYVIALPRESGDPTKYVLSGTSRLIFG